MKILLDTHSFLWFVAGDSQLSDTARRAIENIDNQRFLSLASVWEMAIKISLGKLTFTQPFRSFIETQLEINNIELLQVEIAHTATIITLPFHHRDPFDRLLIAQAQVEGMFVVSNDVAFDAYEIKRLW